MFQSYADSPGVPLPVNAAGCGVGTGAAAVEEKHDPGRVGPALPEGELAAIGTLAVAARHDLLPTGGSGARLIWRGAIVEDAVASLSGGVHLDVSPCREGIPTTMNPFSLTCGSGKPSTPLSRMHWANSDSVSSIASDSPARFGSAMAVPAPVVSGGPALSKTRSANLSGGVHLDVSPRRKGDPDHDDPVLIDLRVGEAVDAVVTHAFGELGLGLEHRLRLAGEVGVGNGGGRRGCCSGAAGVGAVVVVAACGEQPGEDQGGDRGGD